FEGEGRDVAEIDVTEAGIAAPAGDLVGGGKVVDGPAFEPVVHERLVARRVGPGNAEPVLHQHPAARLQDAAGLLEEELLGVGRDVAYALLRPDDVEGAVG